MAAIAELESTARIWWAGSVVLPSSRLRLLWSFIVGVAAGGSWGGERRELTFDHAPLFEPELRSSLRNAASLAFRCSFCLCPLLEG